MASAPIAQAQTRRTGRQVGRTHYRCERRGTGERSTERTAPRANQGRQQGRRRNERSRAKRSGHASFRFSRPRHGLERIRARWREKRVRGNVILPPRGCNGKLKPAPHGGPESPRRGSTFASPARRRETRLLIFEKLLTSVWWRNAHAVGCPGQTRGQLRSGVFGLSRPSTSKSASTDAPGSTIAALVDSQVLVFLSAVIDRAAHWKSW